MRTIGVADKLGVPQPPAAAPERHSAWRTPLPYLFGGMVAMMLLIITALLILLHSYWKHTSRLERAEREQRGLGWGPSGVSGGEGSKKASYSDKFVVIMAGDDNPTCLATPRCYTGFAAVEGEKQSLETKVAAVKGSKSEDETTTSRVEEESLRENPAVD